MAEDLSTSVLPVQFDPQTETILKTLLDITSGVAQGDVFFVDSHGHFRRLSPGTSGQKLTTGGADANPSWADVAGTDITIASQAQGDILYYNGTDWVRLAASTSGRVLNTNGAGANPSWEPTTIRGVGVRCHKSGSQNIGGDMTEAELTFDVNDFDTAGDSMHSVSVNASRINIKTAGRYVFGFTAYFSPGTAHEHRARIALGGTSTYLCEAADQNSSAPNFIPTLSASGTYNFAVNDYIVCLVTHDTGGPNYTAFQNSSFWAYLLPSI